MQNEAVLEPKDTVKVRKGNWRKATKAARRSLHQWRNRRHRPDVPRVSCRPILLWKSYFAFSCARLCSLYAHSVSILQVAWSYVEIKKDAPSRDISFHDVMSLDLDDEQVL